MKRPEKILEAFKTLSDEAAREVAELRMKRGQVMQAQVNTLREVEKGFDDSRRDRTTATMATAYGNRQLDMAKALGNKVKELAEAEYYARDILLERFADQKRFEVYLSQRQIKERQLERKLEEKKLLEQIDQLAQKKVRLEEDE